MEDIVNSMDGNDDTTGSQSDEDTPDGSLEFERERTLERERRAVHTSAPDTNLPRSSRSRAPRQDYYETSRYDEFTRLNNPLTAARGRRGRGGVRGARRGARRGGRN